MNKNLLLSAVFTIIICLGLNAQTPSANCNTAAGSELTVGVICNNIAWDSNNNSDYWDGAAGCFSGDFDDAWGWFTATSTSTTITYEPNANRDAILTLFDAACDPNMVSLDCSDAGGNGVAETIVFNTVIGIDYKVRIQIYNSNINMNGQICVSNTPSPPDNDDCADATNIGVSSDDTCTTSVSATTVSATQSITGINCNNFTGNADDDVWFSFIATATNHDITVSPGILNDLVIELRSGACNGTNIDCADNTVGAANEVINATGLTIGATYYVRVYSYGGAGDAGTFDICITTPGPYCSTTTETPDALYITNVSFQGTLEDTSNTSGFAAGYQDFTGLTPIARQVEGEGVNVFVGATFSGRIKAWIDWNNDGNFDNDPNTELVYDTNGINTAETTFGFIIPLGTAAGDYRIRIRNYTDSVDTFSFGLIDYDACQPFIDGFTDDWGEAEDYLFTVEPICNAIITSITGADTCGPGSVTINATATGTPSVIDYRWYANEIGGTPLATTATGTWNTPSLSATTTYWVTTYNGACESWARTPIIVNFNPIPTLSVSPDITNRVVCGEDNALEISAIGDIDDVYLFNEDFEVGTLGVFSNIIILDNGPTINALTSWQNRTSTFIPNEQVWFPAISSGFGSNQFVMSNSDVGPSITNNALETTNSYDTTDFTSLTLSLRSYYSRYWNDGDQVGLDYVAIEASTDGTTWTNVTPNIIADVGIGNRFETLSYNLDAYINEPTLSVRIRFYGDWVDGVAVDDVKLFGDQDITAVSWSTSPAGIIDLYIDTDNDNIGDTPYSTGAFTTVYAIPNITQLEQATYSFTINATLSNNCGAATLPFTVTNNTKIWNGSDNNTWGDPDNWYPNGIPTNDSCVIIEDVGALPNPTILGPPFPPSPSFARNLTIKNNGYLELEPSTSLTVTDWINVDPSGTFNVRNSANLVQITNVATNNNTGTINMQREVSGLTSSDYVYWSSAVENFNVLGVSPGSNAGLILEWRPTVAGNGAGNYGEWQATSENMIPGKGYAIRGLAGTATANAAEFTGRPSNGIINMPINRGTYDGIDYSGSGSTFATAIDDNWNLVGNPFPSALNTDTFITRNAANITDDIDPTIAGTVYLWSHQSAPSNAVTDPFYGDYVYNYNPNDYIAYNLTGSAPPGFNGFIGAGQAFFVLMDDAATSPSNLVFDNTMRNGVYSNDQFYRIDHSTESEETTVNEKNRIWLDLIDSNNNANSILVGYIHGATNTKDRLYDGTQFAGTNTLFYSLIENDKMSIQGRALPFEVTDVVPLGYEIPQNGDYSIAINHVDGLFETSNQDIFLEDTYTNTIHNLRLSAYTFNSESGLFNDRFVLRYNEDTLSLEELKSINGLTILVPNGKYIKIQSTLSPIQQIAVYDLLGRVVIDRPDVGNLSELTIETKQLSTGGYIVKVNLIDGIIKTQKIILKQ
ncbi:GEVED domain-containing protein [Psychroserpens burtonensis]|uniref:GEVED domain-containing protein n=1 Tax=Psychroserpens burtonensis TaxID=49278 RepID=UPI000427B8BD|nr:GEVED domain-containing protein [Psychroserpens burtonensis]